MSKVKYDMVVDSLAAATGQVERLEAAMRGMADKALVETLQVHPCHT